MSEYICNTDDKCSMCEMYKTAEPIIRCRDCKYYVKDPYPIDPGWPMMCKQLGRDMLEPYGFCAWASRKEVDA